MRTIAFIVLSLLLFSCKTAQRPKMNTPLDEAAIKTLNEGTYYVYSEPIEKQTPLFFPLLPKEYQEKAQSSSKFKLQVKADSLYVSYQKVKDSTTTVTMRAGFKGKQKKNFWQRYNRFRIYPFIPIYLGVDIDRIRIAPDKDGNLLVEVYRDLQGAVFLIQFFNTYYDTFVFKREEQTQKPISNELSKETTTE